MKFPYQTKTKNQKIKTKRIFLIGIIILGAVLISTAPLLHMIFPKTNSELNAYKKDLALAVLKIENKLIDNRCNLENNNIDKERYLYDLDLLNIEKENIMKHNNEALDIFIDNNRVFGWKTTRVFAIGFGVRLPYLLLSLIISFLIFKIKTEEKYLKRCFFWLQVACYFICFYFMFWVFWTSQDFPLKVYRWIFIIISVLASIITVSFISYREVFKLKTSKIITELILLIINNNKYIKSKEDSEKNLDENIKKIEKIIT